MAVANRTLIDALRTTAARLSGGAPYRWTHMGACNCGHLAQTVTKFKPEEIHRIALERSGDWHEQVLDHCPSVGLPMDHLIDTLLELGLSRKDLAHLERLSDPELLRRLPAARRELDYRSRADVVAYLSAFADHLEAGLELELGRARAGGRVRNGAPSSSSPGSEAESVTVGGLGR